MRNCGCSTLSGPQGKWSSEERLSISCPDQGLQISLLCSVPSLCSEWVAERAAKQSPLLPLPQTGQRLVWRGREQQQLVPSPSRLYWSGSGEAKSLSGTPCCGRHRSLSLLLDFSQNWEEPSSHFSLLASADQCDLDLGKVQGALPYNSIPSDPQEKLSRGEASTHFSCGRVSPTEGIFLAERSFSHIRHFSCKRNLMNLYTLCGFYQERSDSPGRYVTPVCNQKEIPILKKHNMLLEKWEVRGFSYLFTRCGPMV